MNVGRNGSTIPSQDPGQEASSRDSTNSSKTVKTVKTVASFFGDKTKSLRFFACLVLAVAASVALHGPLIANAAHHMDSDLAVDGYTLHGFLHGQLRWHFPGTPAIGTTALLPSLPWAGMFGATPETLAAGGVSLAVFGMVATCLLLRRLHGDRVALWSLAPWVFSPIGIFWLSGRVTGGHLLVVGWQAMTWYFVARLGTSPTVSPRWLVGLGIWCGLGIYGDMLFLLTAAVALPLLAWWSWRWAGGFRAMVLSCALISLGLGVGLIPKIAGAWSDPYSAYEGQFQPTFRVADWSDHTRLLLTRCLPRLLTGHEGSQLRTAPAPRSLGHQGALSNIVAPQGDPGDMLIAVFLLGMTFAGAGMLLKTIIVSRNIVTRDILLGTCLVSVLTLIAFVVNSRVENSDHYRYLTPLILPWTWGIGLLFDNLAAKGRSAAVIFALAFSVLIVWDLGRWYQRFGWWEWPARPLVVKPNEPALDWLRENAGDSPLFGAYWDVYRMGFLTDPAREVLPYPIYPNRFPDWAPGVPGGQPCLLISRRNSLELGRYFEAQCLRAGGREIARFPGVVIYEWPAIGNGNANGNGNGKEISPTPPPQRAEVSPAEPRETSAKP